MEHRGSRAGGAGSRAESSSSRMVFGVEDGLGVEDGSAAGSAGVCYRGLGVGGLDGGGGVSKYLRHGAKTWRMLVSNSCRVCRVEVGTVGTSGSLCTQHRERRLWEIHDVRRTGFS